METEHKQTPYLEKDKNGSPIEGKGSRFDASVFVEFTEQPFWAGFIETSKEVVSYNS